MFLNEHQTPLAPKGLFRKDKFPTIVIINFSVEVSENQSKQAVYAINKQVEEEFWPCWGMGRTLELQTTLFQPQGASAVIYLVNDQSIATARRYHLENSLTMPFGLVNTDTNMEHWPATLSHKVLELMLGPSRRPLSRPRIKPLGDKKFDISAIAHFVSSQRLSA